MSYKLERWNNPGRPRNCKADHNSPDYCKYYDLDLCDFTDLAGKLRNNQRLTEEENDRYAVYLYTIIYIVLENPKFKNKPKCEKEELFDRAIFELLTAIPKFDSDRGSSIYSFAYRCTYNAFIHYYTELKVEANREKQLVVHLWDCWKDYRDEVQGHQVKNINYNKEDNRER